MRVSTFFASTLPQGMEKVREALGPKAVVLSWRNARGGIEISASVQSDEILPQPLPKQRQEAIADHFSPGDLVPKKLPQNQTQTRGLGALVSRNMPIPRSTQAPVVKQHTSYAANPIGQDKKDTSRAIPSERNKAPSTPDAKPSRLFALLVRAGLTPHQAQVLGVNDGPELRKALTNSLSVGLKFDPIEAIPPKPLLLVGPPGSGKSTCAAKLAARTLSAGHEILLISADSERCGGSDQLCALAKRLGARFEVVTTLADLTDLVINARQRGMVVIVDAPSACPAQPADMRATARMISETKLEPIVCLPADMRPDDLDELALAYRAIGAVRCIATRLDLTSRRASVLFAAKAADMALAQFSATPYISGGVAIATPARVAAMLLEPFEDALAEDAA
jgi:flagellar biosynthesis protein FlhF